MKKIVLTITLFALLIPSTSFAMDDPAPQPWLTNKTKGLISLSVGLIGGFACAGLSLYLFNTYKDYKNSPRQDERDAAAKYLLLSGLFACGATGLVSVGSILCLVFSNNQTNHVQEQLNVVHEQLNTANEQLTQQAEQLAQHANPMQFINALRGLQPDVVRQRLNNLGQNIQVPEQRQAWLDAIPQMLQLAAQEPQVQNHILNNPVVSAIANGLRSAGQDAIQSAVANVAQQQGQQIGDAVVNQVQHGTQQAKTFFQNLLGLGGNNAPQANAQGTVVNMSNRNQL